MENMLNFLNETIVVGDEKVQTETKTEEEIVQDDIQNDQDDTYDVDLDLDNTDSSILIKENTKKETNQDNTQDNDQKENLEITPSRVLYEYLLEQGYLDEQSDIENIESVLDEVPKNLLAKEIANLPQKAKDFLLYAYKMGDSFSDEHFDKYFNLNSIENSEPEEVIKNHIKKDKTLSVLYDSDDKIENYIDDLKSTGDFDDVVKKLKQIGTDDVKQKLEQESKEAEQNRKDREEYQKKLVQSIHSSIDSTGWTKERKEKVLQNLSPTEVNRKNLLITNSPKAIVQLADIYSYFDEEKKEFDFSKLIDAKADTKNSLKSISMLEKMKIGQKDVKNVQRSNKTDSLKII